MLRRTSPTTVLLLLALLGPSQSAEAAAPGTYAYDPHGAVRAVRSADVDGDGRIDLVLLVQTPQGAEEVLVLRTPAEPLARSYYPPDHVVRIPLVGELSAAGALAVGRFGPEGEVRLRFLGPSGILDRTPAGAGAPGAPGAAARPGPATLLGRSPGRTLVFWDGVGDLDADGRDECWYPLASGDGALLVRFGALALADRVLDLSTTNRAASTAQHGLARYAYVPSLFPADLDGDGLRELLALRDGTLMGWAPAAAEAAAEDAAPLSPCFRLELPFLAGDADRSSEELRTPRIQVEDVNGDGKADLLVTLITGLRTRLASIRTIFFHYPGPFRDARSGVLVEPAARIDTQSIVLHPTFVDLDGDGAREYVGDSIRGTMLDLIARMMGRDPNITHVGFRFDKAIGTFGRAPAFTVERDYAAQEALSNRFGRSARFEGDFDGDGHRDMLDLGNLQGVEILRGRTTGGATTFEQALLPRVPVQEGLIADAVVADLNGDGRSDAVLWSATRLYLVVSRKDAR